MMMRIVIREIHTGNHVIIVIIVDSMNVIHTVKIGGPKEEAKDLTVITGIQTMTNINAPELTREMITAKIQTGIVATRHNMTGIIMEEDPTIMIIAITIADPGTETTTRDMTQIATEIPHTTTREERVMMKTMVTVAINDHNEINGLISNNTMEEEMVTAMDKINEVAAISEMIRTIPVMDITRNMMI
jgi:hypothetical protein